jgi:hypothetical protein
MHEFRARMLEIVARRAVQLLGIPDATAWTGFLATLAAGVVK